MAEIASHTLHNVYTLRGAKIRDALAWSRHINEAIHLFGGEAEVVFASHHWPTWGNAEILRFLKGQRDLYRYIHDETLRLANHGYGPAEIAEMVELPAGIAGSFANRGYYGSVSHNVKAVYTYYLGFFDGNPATLHQLPPVEGARKAVEYMGGADAVLARARADFEKGEYRWVAQAVNYVVFADPDNAAARELQADTLEQLGYQAENGTWRNFYLSAARELRDGVVVMPTPSTRLAGRGAGDVGRDVPPATSPCGSTARRPPTAPTCSTCGSPTSASATSSRSRTASSTSRRTRRPSRRRRPSPSTRAAMDAIAMRQATLRAT